MERGRREREKEKKKRKKGKRKETKRTQVIKISQREGRKVVAATI